MPSLTNMALQHCISAAPAGGLLGERVPGLRQRPVSSTSSPTGEEADKSTDKTQKSLNVGLLSEDSSTEEKWAQGVIEEGRSDAAARDLNAPNPPQQNDGENQQSRVNKEDNKAGAACSPGCRKDWLKDGWCDTLCNTEACNFDEGDCTGWCSGDCKPSWQGDGLCDAACYVAACNWDAGDCAAWKEQGVQPLERRALQQKQKMLKQHRLQLPKCKCERRLLVNGSCTPECNVPECLFDGGECLDMCNANCSKSWLGDGDCDRECDNPECGHDKGDCDSKTNASMQAIRKKNGNNKICDSSCRLWMIGNGVCDSQCNNIACGYDSGDCDNVTAVVEVDYSVKPEAVYQFCAKEWIGDGHCDPNCYNKPSRWDGGDCEGTALEKEQAAKGIGPQFDQ
ncbi:notch (DSL) domain-containing protein, putative [Eimeria necatrix]|uniref:Notch (DSL) domain-containing protein, putative n=1 Tax=Eimeria necatrix TaxID=51315 RepID=U6MVI6_9EIME|nr:notch (DSL) domain-containing protein, putative [Eimeria necatrix]CDJ68252.1 notch (DSL) domain-containing protein, putative [Eimeria necatrix]